MPPIAEVKKLVAYSIYGSDNVSSVWNSFYFIFCAFTRLTLLLLLYRKPSQWRKLSELSTLSRQVVYYEDTIRVADNEKH